MLKTVFKILTLDFENQDDNIQECSLCFEDKVLVKFCNNHNICKKCSETWIEKSFFCPICRDVCTNNDFLKYNFEIKHANYDQINEFNLHQIFKFWHKRYCIRRSHKFNIYLSKDNNKLILHCNNCNIEEKFNKYNQFDS